MSSWCPTLIRTMHYLSADVSAKFPFRWPAGLLCGYLRYAFEGGAGGGVELAGHAAGEPGLASGEDGVLHGFCHEDGIGGGGDGGVHEYAVGAHFHGESGVGRGAHTGVDDERDGGDFFAENLQRGAILNAEARADGGSEGHDGCGAGIDEAMREDDVVGGVGKNGES